MYYQCNCPTNIGREDRELKQTCLHIAQQALGSGQEDSGDNLIKTATKIYEFLKAEDKE